MPIFVSVSDLAAHLLVAENSSAAPVQPAATPGPTTQPGTTMQAGTTMEPPPSNPSQRPVSQDSGWGSTMVLMLPLLLLVVWMIFSKRKEDKARKALVESLKRGDKVVTIGGAHGTVESVGEQTIDVRLGQADTSAVVTFTKSAVAANVSQAEKKA